MRNPSDLLAPARSVRNGPLPLANCFRRFPNTAGPQGQETYRILRRKLCRHHFRDSSLPPDKACDSQRRHRERSHLVAGYRSEEARFFAHKLVKKAERSVCDQIKVKVLGRQQAPLAQVKHTAECQEIEKDFHRHRWPARQTIGILQRVPTRLTADALAAAVKPAANPAKDDGDGSDQREPITGSTAVIQKPLGYFHAGVAAEQPAEDSFARRKLEPAVLVVPMQPPFRRKIDKFGAKKRAPERSEVYHEKP